MCYDVSLSSSPKRPIWGLDCYLQGQCPIIRPVKVFRSLLLRPTGCWVFLGFMPFLGSWRVFWIGSYKKAHSSLMWFDRSYICSLQFFQSSLRLPRLLPRHYSGNSMIFSYRFGKRILKEISTQISLSILLNFSFERQTFTQKPLQVIYY